MKRSEYLLKQIQDISHKESGSAYIVSVLATLLFLSVSAECVAQVYVDEYKYDMTSDADYSSVAIKAPSWSTYHSSGEYNDMFDESSDDFAYYTEKHKKGDGSYETIKTKVGQIAHTYVDTLYVHKGTTTELYLPFINTTYKNEADIKSYYRWFNYRTGGNFYCLSNDDSDREEVTYTVYFTNSGSWSGTTFYAYVWGANGDITNAFPGNACTWNGSYYVCTFTTSEIPQGILFDNDDESQTGNLKLYNNGYYNTDGYVSGGTLVASPPYDLLTHVGGTGGYEYYGQHYYYHYRFKNGYVGGKWCYEESDKDAVGGGGQYSNAFSRVLFYYPTDDEFAEIIKNNADFNGANGKNDFYAIACDYSNYDDYGSSNTTLFSSGNHRGFVNGYGEPTLIGRVLYYIVAVDDITTAADVENIDANDPLYKFQSYFSKLITHKDDYTVGNGNNGESYLEEYDITFPARHSAYSDELVGLTKDARAYAIPGVIVSTTTESVNGTDYLSNLDFSAGNNNWTLCEGGGSWVESEQFKYNWDDYRNSYDLIAVSQETSTPLPAGSYTLTVDINSISDKATTNLYIVLFAQGESVSDGWQQSESITSDTSTGTKSFSFTTSSSATIKIGIKIQYEGSNQSFTADNFVLTGTAEITTGDTETLDISLTSAAGITRVNSTLSGMERAIKFTSSSATTISNGSVQETQWEVADKSTATICVTKTVDNVTYNIAKYNITFKKDSDPLTGAQVAYLDKKYDDETEKGSFTEYWWTNYDPYKYRSPKYLQKLVDSEEFILLADLTFDTNSTAGTSSSVYSISDTPSQYFYAFPIKWDYTGYGFNAGIFQQDGMVYDNLSSPATVDDDHRVNAAQYALMSNYYGYEDAKEYGNNFYGYGPLSKLGPQYDTAKDNSTYGEYWLYVDGTQTPGTIAEIPLNDNLCSGTKMYVSAWMKGSNGIDPTGGAQYNRDDSSVIMTINGVKTDEDNNEISTPLYSFSSGQIRKTTYITNFSSSASVDNTDEDGISASISGKGSTSNEWMQIYFTLTLDTKYDNVGFENYTLTLQNYCASSDGADFYFDDVAVYIAHAVLDVAEIEAVCNEDDGTGELSSQGRGKYRVDFDYEHLTQYAEDGSVCFAIIDASKYNEFIENYGDGTNTEFNAQYDGIDEDNYKDYAIEAAAITIYLSEDGTTGVKFGKANFDTSSFTANSPQYDSDSDNLLTSGNNYQPYYNYIGEGVEQTEVLSFDCWAYIDPNTKYWLLTETPAGTWDDAGTDLSKAATFATNIEGSCANKQEVYIPSKTVMKLNGETEDDTSSVCVGQAANISISLNYTDEDGETQTLAGLYADFFYGTEDEYLDNTTYSYLEEGKRTASDYDECSLFHALYCFRENYPAATNLMGVDTVEAINEGDVAFTSGMLALIEECIDEGLLVLHRTSISAIADTDGINIIAQPIKIDVSDLETDEQICFGYVPINVPSSGEAPQVLPGMYNVAYPDSYVPSVRLGLAQINSATSDANPITVYLRDAVLATEYDSNGTPLDTKTAQSIISDAANPKLYLVDTDDPNYNTDSYLGKDDLQVTDIPVGTVYSFNAIEDDTDGSSKMQIYFDTENYTFREGYYYMMMVYFVEEDGEQHVIETSCPGSFPLEIKVVPEYLVWNGSATDNWNRDAAWTIATSDDLKGLSYAGSSGSGYVPMDFTKVVMPENSQAELYMAGFKENNASKLEWQDETAAGFRGGVTTAPTENIMYDMMVYDPHDVDNTNTSALNTGLYRVNICNQIHFETGAQLLHPEFLIYNKAWTDISIEPSKWVLTSTPLKDVVSGDWYGIPAAYTASNLPYFTDINFKQEGDGEYTFNRKNPLVYQRSWSGAGSIVYSSSTQSVPVYAATGWSSVYNDTYSAFNPGVGYAIKAYSYTLDGDNKTVETDGKRTASTNNITFRLPKADTSYEYSSGSLNRTNPGKLLVSDMVKRTGSDVTATTDAGDVYVKDLGDNTKNAGVTATLTPSNGYAIVGNPYTAYLSLDKFFATNGSSGSGVINNVWCNDADGPIINSSGLTSYGTDGSTVSPYGAFFVQAASADATSLSIKFTDDMQVLKSASGGAKATLVAFSIRAQGTGGMSGASFVYSDNATDEYDASEDAVLMSDVSWESDSIPMVYTVAGDMAVGVNRLKEQTVIPLGVFAADESKYTLTFAGTQFIEDPILYDAELNTETPITEGLTIEMEGASHGRYFIRTSGAATGITETKESYGMTAYSPYRQSVTVSSNAEINTVEIYSIGGMLEKKTEAVGGIACTIDGVESGIAIVRVHTSEGTFTRKITVR